MLDVGRWTLEPAEIGFAYNFSIKISTDSGKSNWSALDLSIALTYKWIAMNSVVHIDSTYAESEPMIGFNVLMGSVVPFDSIRFGKKIVFFYGWSGKQNHDFRTHQVVSIQYWFVYWIRSKFQKTLHICFC